ncbi:hypothetical protein P691DRAFT_778468 [Macrolepiota fuliginosa MF-IS2]|uniref:MYND-type domain-containing protein n=1 Tax=Macrolepiota fuliginosa MF-IS2 TaxID=1400762 RepID=A0A9P5X3Y1_9AGAR|nr:hypothetical protein P691DRAFT_778468 [Macrolepiota fuliginosa MF-IS2]
MLAHECKLCHDTDPAPKQCSACKKAWYCSKECQQHDWVQHIFDCNLPRAITTADYLALAVNQNLLPDHPQTIIDYGFANMIQPEMLLGLYIGLLSPSYLGVKPYTLHKWRLKDTLVENIKREFESIPEAARGAYFPWFLQNEHVVSGARAEEAQRKFKSEADEWSRRAWCFIGRSPTASMDDIRQYQKSASREEKDCFFLYTNLLSGYHPSPAQDLWIYFGFCACNSQEAEMELARLYKMLINRCTFNQFLKAYTSYSLVSLFKDKEVNITDPLIIDVLSGIGGTHGWKSVWRLKQYIELKSIHGPDDTTIKPTPSIRVDYGLFNCRTSEEHKLLLDLYKGFFALGRGVNPLQLHQACIEGRLFMYFAQELSFKIKPRKTYERLLKNLYPLPDL